MPGLIGERIFKLFDLDKDDYLKELEFKKGFLRLFASNFEENIKLVYDLFDFDSDGKVSKEDIRILLSYVPLVHTLELINTNKEKLSEGLYTKNGGGMYYFNTFH